MKKFWIISILFLLVVLCFGCAPTSVTETDQPIGVSSVVDVEDEDVDVDVFATATPPPFPDLRGSSYDVYFIGAVSDIYFSTTASISAGLQDGFTYVNSNGGVFGAKINYHFVGVRDYDEELMEAFSNLVENETPFVILLASPITQEFYELVNKSEVPVLYYGVGGTRLEPPEGDDYLFWLTPLPDQQMAFVLHEIWKNWNDIRPLGTFNEVKVGYVTWQDVQSYLSLTPQTRVFIQRNNYTLELEEALPVSVNTSVTNFLLDAVVEGVTVLFTDTISYGPAVLWNDLHSLGLSDFFVVSGTQWVMGEEVFEFVREPLQTDQVFFPMSTAWWTEVDNPAVAEAIKISELSERTVEERQMGYLLSLGAVDIVRHVLDAIINEQESGKVDDQIFMDTLTGLKDYSVMDGLFVVDYTRNNRLVTGVRLWSFSLEEGMVPIGGLTDVPELPMVEE